MLKKTNTERLDGKNCLVIDHLLCIRSIMFFNENYSSQNNKKNINIKLFAEHIIKIISKKTICSIRLFQGFYDHNYQ